MIEHNIPIEIRAVGNGYLVMPSYRHNPNSVLSEDKDLMVFESRPSLLQWLSAHFDLPDTGVY